jgi:hypothetical protein
MVKHDERMSRIDARFVCHGCRFVRIVDDICVRRAGVSWSVAPERRNAHRSRWAFHFVAENGGFELRVGGVR